jgi:hypothetical protein
MGQWVFWFGFDFVRNFFFMDLPFLNHPPNNPAQPTLLDWVGLTGLIEIVQLMYTPRFEFHCDTFIG